MSSTPEYRKLNFHYRGHLKLHSYAEPIKLLLHPISVRTLPETEFRLSRKDCSSCLLHRGVFS